MDDVIILIITTTLVVIIVLLYVYLYNNLDKWLEDITDDLNKSKLEITDKEMHLLVEQVIKLCNTFLKE